MSSHSDSFVASGSPPTWRLEVPFPPDFRLENHGSILLLRPQNEHAILWVDEHIGSGNGFQPYWPTVVVEHRYIMDIVANLREEGFVVR